MKHLILEDKDGTAVRYLTADSENFYLIHRSDTRRVEAVADPSKCSVRYHIIDRVRLADLQRGPLNIQPNHKLRLVEDDLFPILKSPVLEEEPKKEVRRTAVAVSIVSLLLLLMAFMYSKSFSTDVEEVQTVTIIPRKEIRTVPPMERENVTPAQLKRLGALSVLGSSRVPSQLGGLKVSANSSRGPGLGGTQGSGGAQTSLYGKGMVGAALGLGNNVSGGGGIGTRGKGGGSAGYGSLTLIGSKGTSQLLPLKEEAVFDDGGLDPDEINAVIQRNIGQVRFCYEQALQSLPDLSGRVAIRFIIGGSGHVNIADVTNSSLKNRSVEGCIVSRLKTWKFPEPRGGVNVRVTYPFVLKRVSQG
jgi:hypothetical protein